MAGGGDQAGLVRDGGSWRMRSVRAHPLPAR
jgi:hypothetical protein